MISIQILPSYSPQQADALGVISFAFEMNKRLTEQRDQGKRGWHMPSQISEEELRRQFKKAIKEDNLINIGCLSMMLFHRKRMEDFG